jgi:SAM-dependent methyltransferase
MHAATAGFVARVIETKDRDFGGPFTSVFEIGSRNVNGSVRSLFGPEVSFMGIDVIEGPGVDLVADGREFVGARTVDCVLCVNTVEHVQDWPKIVANAYDMLAPGGWLILTAPSDPFPSHSGVDGLHVRPGEWYQNVSAGKMIGVVCSYGFDLQLVECIPPDSMVAGRKP